MSGGIIMKSMYEQMGGTYTLGADGIYYPDFVFPEEETVIGIWGQRHKEYLRQNHKDLFNELSITGKLNQHLAEADRRANQMLDQLILEMAKREGVNEALKTADQMGWVGRMNNIRARSEEIITQYIVFCI